jgi:hypothetical protein
MLSQSTANLADWKVENVIRSRGRLTRHQDDILDGCRPGKRDCVLHRRYLISDKIVWSSRPSRMVKQDTRSTETYPRF